MSNVRTARALSMLAALPLAATLFTGTASADNGGFADHHSVANVTSATQVATGAGAANQNNTANVVGSGLTRIDQNNVNIDFREVWW